VPAGLVHAGGPGPKVRLFASVLAPRGGGGCMVSCCVVFCGVALREVVVFFCFLSLVFLCCLFPGFCGAQRDPVWWLFLYSPPTLCPACVPHLRSGMEPLAATPPSACAPRLPGPTPRRLPSAATWTCWRSCANASLAATPPTWRTDPWRSTHSPSCAAFAPRSTSVAGSWRCSRTACARSTWPPSRWRTRPRLLPRRRRRQRPKQRARSSPKKRRRRRLARRPTPSWRPSKTR